MHASPSQYHLCGTINVWRVAGRHVYAWGVCWYTSGGMNIDVCHHKMGHCLEIFFLLNFCKNDT